MESPRIAVASLALLLLASPAAANGAMELALGTFHWGLWSAYVAATVIFEAIAFGLILRVALRQALMRSVSANFVTAILGGCVSGVFAYSLFGMFGSVLNPDPFGQTLVGFTLFALLSTPVEAAIWLPASRAHLETASSLRVLAVSIAVHMIGVPLGLAILLVPERPYPGLEMQARAQRAYWLGPHVD